MRAYLHVLLVFHALLLSLADWSAPRLLAQSVLADPVHFWKHESSYAGSKACEGCHAAIYRSQKDSHHALSLRPAREVPQLVAGVDTERTDRASGSIVVLREGSGGEIQLHSRKDSEQSAATLEWAFGSGVKGITPVGRTNDGQFVESRLTWYAGLDAIDFTTGASQYDPTNARQSLGRGLTQKEVTECFECHTTGYDESKQAPARNEMGVRCERCHGPGAKHIKLTAKGHQSQLSIFHPGKIEAFAQLQMCGVCHGRPPRDNDFDGLLYVESTPITVRFPSQRLTLSRCYNETFDGLKCTACHDPHTNAVAASPEKNDVSCNSCHNAEYRKEATICSVGKSKCQSCHMPKERVMRHSLFTDHWIRVVKRGGN